MCRLSVVAGMFILAVLICTGCDSGDGPGGEVIIFTSVDREFAAPVVARFEKETGITARVKYDTEAVKTAGLVREIVAAHDSGRAACDIFWSSAAARTALLEKKGVLAAHRSDAVKRFPEQFSDTRWIGFAARARVIVYNTERLKKKDAPKSVLELADPKWKDRVGIADPLAGSTGSHVSALYLALGEKKADDFFRRLRENGARVYPGNSVVRDRVAQGEVLAGLVDSDDVYAGIESGKPVGMIVPDQEEGGLGALLIPNTVMLISGAPHPKNAKRFLEWLVRPETEKMLAKGGSRQIPLAKDAGEVHPLTGIRTMDVPPARIAEKLDEYATRAKKILSQ